MPLSQDEKALCEGLVQWWHADDPQRRLSMASAHELAGLVMVAQILLDKDALERGRMPVAPKEDG